MANGLVNRFVYPRIGTVGVSSQTATQMIPQPKISFVYPNVGGPTNIQPRLTGNVNQQVDNTIGSQNIVFVTMDTPNLQQIQSFPVVSRQGDVHIHQDPMTGQLYQMTDQIHMGINRFTTTPNITPYLNARSNEILSSIPDSLKKEITNVSVAPYSQVQLVPLNSNSDYYI